MSPTLRLLAIFFLLATLGPACHRQKFRTLVAQVPDLKTGACANALRDRLLGYNERAQNRELLFFREVVVDAAARTLTVTYNSEVTAGLNVLHLIADAGYDATDAANPDRAVKTTPAARGRLPADCR
jgi:hypothetical protein